MKKKEILVNCPTCSEEFSYYEKETRPFCSERCKNHDLVAWTEGQHVIPSKEPLSEQDVETIIRVRRENEIQ